MTEATDPLTEIRAYLALTPLLGTSGQPTLEQFAAVRDAGYETVVSLLPPERNPYGAAEPEIVAALGMEFVNIPVVWAEPRPEDLNRFFEVMDTNAERKLFIHCAANMRVSAFLFLYRVLRLGMPEADAEDDMERIWTPEGVWRAFIDQALSMG